MSTVRVGLDLDSAWMIDERLRRTIELAIEVGSNKSFRQQVGAADRKAVQGIVQPHVLELRHQNRPLDFVEAEIPISDLE